IDSAEVAAVESGAVALGNYDAVIWMAGLQAQVNDIGNPVVQTPAFSASARSRVSQYVNAGGGQLFVSGAEVAWDLNRMAAGTWLRDVLKSGYVARSAGGDSAVGLPESILPEWNGF